MEKRLFKKTWIEWGEKHQEEKNLDYGHNVIEPVGTWKNPIYFGLQTFNEYGLCDMYFATRIETEENELIIQGWKTPEEERITVPINIDRDGKQVFTGIYRILGEMEIKRTISVGKISSEEIVTMLRELNNININSDEKLVELVKRINHTK